MSAPLRLAVLLGRLGYQISLCADYSSPDRYDSLLTELKSPLSLHSDTRIPLKSHIIRPTMSCNIRGRMVLPSTSRSLCLLETPCFLSSISPPPLAIRRLATNPNLWPLFFQQPIPKRTKISLS
ncbi:hypothetical protein HOY80DRAFT_943025 [Tuber brumale]|nr:hypothetical protein HOY80DRAFT_943025 [Tuber brumale]